MSVAPITPKEAQRQHLTEVIPDEVYEAVNEILAEKYCDSGITIYQNEVISRAIEKMQTDEDFFKYNWLNFETSYINAGWTVSFVKPAYNENFKPHWIFRFRK